MRSDWNQTLLPDGSPFFRCALPQSITPADHQITEIWNLHPPGSPIIKMHGKDVAIPRHQQAYMRDYWFSGQKSAALALPEILTPLVKWLQQQDQRLNGILLNWYEPDHYIGPHRDSTVDLVAQSDVYTIVLGEGRLMRFTHAEKRHPRHDVPMEHGDVIKFPLEPTNRHWKHSVPKRKWQSRRISVTARAFK